MLIGLYPLGTGLKKLSADFDQSLGIKVDDTPWAWSLNTYDQLVYIPSCTFDSSLTVLEQTSLGSWYQPGGNSPRLLKPIEWFGCGSEIIVDNVVRNRMTIAREPVVITSVIYELL